VVGYVASVLEEISAFFFIAEVRTVRKCVGYIKQVVPHFHNIERT
jgi:hypothetical protein